MNISEIKKHWRFLISNSSYGKANGTERLSVDIGRSPSYLRGHLSNNSMPGMDVVMALSGKLMCTPNDLLTVGSVPVLDTHELGDIISREVSKAVTEKLWSKSKRPTGKDVMRWWNSNGGRLENCEGFKDRFDLYRKPDPIHRRIEPHLLGRDSLATNSLGVSSPELLERTIAPLGPDFANHILTAHQSSIDNGPITTIETLDATHPDGGPDIRIKYLRTLAPVTLSNGVVCVLNYSELIS